MAYMKRKHIGRGTYLYIVRGYRSRGKVKEKLLEYLGNEAKVDPARLRKAIEYWGVTTKIGRTQKAKPGERR